MTPPKKTYKTVDAYLRALPDKDRKALERLRRTIKSAAPKAEEVISFGMPAFKFHGMLAFYAAFANHCSLFIPGYTILDRFADKLEGFERSKGTIRFQPDRPLPVSLIKAIIKAKVEENSKKAVLKGKTHVKTE